MDEYLISSGSKVPTGKFTTLAGTVFGPRNWSISDVVVRVKFGRRLGSGLSVSTGIDGSLFCWLSCVLGSKRGNIDLIGNGETDDCEEFGEVVESVLLPLLLLLLALLCEGKAR